MTKQIFFIAIGTLLSCATCLSQDSLSGTRSIITDTALTRPDALRNKEDSVHPYHIKAAVEIPVVAAGLAYTDYTFSRISKKSPSSTMYVGSLKKSDVNWFDRWGVRPYSHAIDKNSYIPFYASMPMPLIVLVIDRKLRKDFFKLSFFYVEAITITGALYGSAAGFTNRYRPMVYSPETPIGKKIAADSKKSFFAGHVALVATSTFFMARVLSDYHPQSKLRWLYYSIAGAATVTTAYLRQAAGEHFFSDILLGTAVGTLSGLLTPSLHKNRFFKNQRLTILPCAGQSQGLAAVYRL